MDRENQITDAASFIELAADLPVVDVRTPSEYRRGHIPGAVNLPIFSDEQRAVVGTDYKKRGRVEAILRGLDFVGPEMRSILSSALKIAGPRKHIALYCWRGGMRSENMAWLFRLGGIRTTLLRGGYKNYRNYILNAMEADRKVVIIGGYTGSGKTKILHILKEMGEQVIDLEDIASHRGSAFGSLGMPDQPTSEHFANMVFSELNYTTPSATLFMEDESRNIGSVFMPDELYNVIRRSPVIALMPDSASRTGFLMEEYGKFEPRLLRESVLRISKRLGGDRTREALEAIDAGNIKRAVEIALEYYDKAYLFGLSKRNQDEVIKLDTSGKSFIDSARLIVKTAGERQK
ncbi:MAG: tRNA 2-selenouridine(34) synthase MnmH [Bacteroidales bacterium]|nr:tRNA 2-selenouridine(34) synthase MnmH [Bacteroidales bacterium]